MNLTTYFSTTYTSSTNGVLYTKISVEIEGKGVFCVVVNPNGNVQVQRYPFSRKPRNTVNFIGRNRSGLYINEEIASGWNGFDTDTKRKLEIAVSYLWKSFAKYSARDCSLTYDDSMQIKRYIKALNSYLAGGCISFDDVDKLSRSEEAKADDENHVADDTNNECKNDDENHTVDNDGDTDDENHVADNASRRTVMKAYITDNTGLNEFVNGCFYPIIKTISYNGKNYIVVQNDDGEERTIDESRANIVNVYDEAPQA